VGGSIWRGGWLAGLGRQRGWRGKPGWRVVPAGIYLIQIISNSLQSWFDKKYGCDGFELRNNFPYWNFSRFGMEFELKSREASMSWFQLKFDWKFLGLQNLMNFVQQATLYI
jgi:hypothetical protein